jgi:hypothetical protein
MPTATAAAKVSVLSSWQVPVNGDRAGSVTP